MSTKFDLRPFGYNRADERDGSSLAVLRLLFTLLHHPHSWFLTLLRVTFRHPKKRHNVINFLGSLS